ncbi:MAG: hypothetical protein Pg6A_12630 [Termitinemataceae bacterium]|nr:MAG: hypothetical protein Pg6A_12630 [Termitinemataceae bacterium]
MSRSIREGIIPKQFLTDVPEIILFFDADEAGRKASGLDPIGGKDKRKSNIPQIILKAGYTGKIRIAELPPIADTGYKDQDALIAAGKRDAVTKAIAEAKEYAPPPVTEADEKEDKKYDIQYPDLSLQRLKCLLRKVQRKN